MADKSSLPSFEDYFVPAVSSFKKGGGSLTIEEMEEAVGQQMALSDELLAVPHGDGPRTQFQYELAWVRTYLKKYGALSNSERGVWSLTPKGAELSPAEIITIPKWVREDDRERRKRIRQENELEISNPASNDDKTSDLDWKEQLLELLLHLEPSAFERLCQRLLRESGFTKVEVTGRTGDGGIDGTGVLRVTLLSFQVLFQCKRWKGTVGASLVRDFRGAMVGRADKGLVITTGTFSADARREATRDGAPAIDLLDGDALCDLMKNLNLGVKTELVEEVSVLSEQLRVF
jgi:restriction system protein